MKDPDSLFGVAAIRDDLDISSMTFWRLEHHPDPAMRFPKPDVWIGRQKKWRADTYRQWKDDVFARGLVNLSRKDLPAFVQLDRNVTKESLRTKSVRRNNREAHLAREKEDYLAR
jgi:hypothetical protein